MRFVQAKDSFVYLIIMSNFRVNFGI